MKTQIHIFKKVVVIATFLALTFSPISALYAAPVLPEAPVQPSLDILKPVVPEAPKPPMSTTTEANPSTGTAGDSSTVVGPVAVADPTTEVGAVAGVLDAALVGSGAESDASNATNLTGSDTERLSHDGQTTEIHNDNLATADNSISLNASSGSNDANYNTGDGGVVSGDANIMLSVLNLINTVFISPEGGGIGLILGNYLGDLIGDYIVGPVGEMYSLTGSRLDVGNDATGANSDNKAIVSVGSETAINNLNDGSVANNIDLDASTGNNQSSYNTGNGNVKTGDANVSLNLLNMLNNIFIARDFGLVGVLNIFGNFVGNLVIPQSMVSQDTNNGKALDVTVSNENTGAGSDNQASLTVDNSTDIDNDNQSDIGNDVNLVGTTGNNSSSYNTGNGEVASGDVDARLNVANTANQNIIGDTVFYAIINVLGEWTGLNALRSLFNTVVVPNPAGGETILVTNANTGAGSTNEADVSLVNETAIDNGNYSQIDNNVDVNANTGGNTVSYNTGNGSVSSGNVNILANIFNLSNINVVANKFAFFIVNIFGDWNGNIDDHGADPTGGGGSTTVDNGGGTVVVAHTTSQGNRSARVLSASAFPGDLVLASTPLDDMSSETAVLAANDYLVLDQNSQDIAPINPFLKFLGNNMWNILILLAISLITFATYVYIRQRGQNQLS